MSKRELPIICTDLFYVSFQMPSGVVKQIEKIQRDFFWNGLNGHHSHHLAGWNVVYRIIQKEELVFDLLEE